MAFTRARFNGFAGFLNYETGNPDIENRIIAENFILEERLSELREDSYGTHHSIDHNWDSWKSAHENYLETKIYIKTGIPETFTGLNDSNLFPPLDQEQYLVRLEKVDRLNRFLGGTLDEMMRFFQEFLKNPADRGKSDVVNDILYKWNQDRDLRPLFAGFWGEVKDIFKDAYGNNIEDENWANRLRDRFGLGHLNPAGKSPIPVLLFYYPVKDVLNHGIHNIKKMAIPTVLDGSLSPFFCPTPKKSWKEGQALDLSDGDDNNYSINSEILHCAVEYKPGYLFKAGWITLPPGKSLEKARKIHMEFMRNEFESNEDETLN